MSKAKHERTEESDSAHRAPNDTGLLTVIEQGDKRVLEIDAPGFGSLMRTEAGGLVAFLAFWVVLIAVGILPFNATAIAIGGAFVAIFGTAMALDYYKESKFRLVLRASRDRLEVWQDAGGMWRSTLEAAGQPVTAVISEQPHDLYCQNMRPRRLPLVSRKLTIAAGDFRVEIGSRLSYDELKYVRETILERTGWREVRRVSAKRWVVATVIILAIAAGVGYLFGPLAYEYGITPSVWQGQVAVGLMAASAQWGGVVIFSELSKNTAESEHDG